MGYMNEFPHSRMFDSDLREILEFFNSILGVPSEIEKLKEMVENLNLDEAVSKKIDKLIADGKFNEVLATLVGFVSPQMYGAKGDGISDDTLSIQNCISAANDNNLPVSIPSGRYLITDTLRIPPWVDFYGSGSAINPIYSENEQMMHGDNPNGTEFIKKFNGTGIIVDCGGRVGNFTVVSNRDIFSGVGIQFKGGRNLAEKVSAFGHDIGILAGNIDPDDTASLNLGQLQNFVLGYCNTGFHIESYENNAQSVNIHNIDARACKTGIYINNQSSYFYGLAAQFCDDFGIRFGNKAYCNGIFGQYTESNGIEVQFDEGSGFNSIYSSRYQQYTTQIVDNDGRNRCVAYDIQAPYFPCIKGITGFNEIALFDSAVDGAKGSWRIKPKSDGLGIKLYNTGADYQSIEVEKSEDGKIVDFRLHSVIIGDSDNQLDGTRIKCLNIYNIPLGNVTIAPNSSELIEKGGLSKSNSNTPLFTQISTGTINGNSLAFSDEFSNIRCEAQLAGDTRVYIKIINANNSEVTINDLSISLLMITI